MSRGMGLGVLCLVLSGLGCQGTQPQAGPEPNLVLDQLTAREDAYHATATTLDDMAALRASTAQYAGDMQNLLDSMGEACGRMRQGESTMRQTMDDMTGLIDHMRNCIHDYKSRLEEMHSLDEMTLACNQHHSVMSEMLDEMDAMLGNLMTCCGGR